MAVAKLDLKVFDDALKRGHPEWVVRLLACADCVHLGGSRFHRCERHRDVR